MDVTTKSCGSCTLCCKLLDVEEIAKPPEAWCVHADKARGCRIYAERPQSCRSFNCLWLLEDGLGPEIRPDKVRTVMLGFDIADGSKTILALCDRATPLAWRAEPIRGKLRRGALQGYDVYAMAGSRYWRILPDHDVEIDVLPLPIRIRGKAA